MKTNLEQIRKLIEAFYEGDTTQHEEELLMRYFASDEVDDSLNEEREYFQQLASLPQVEIPTTLTPRIDKLFDEIERRNPTRRRWIIALSSAAAAIAIIFMSIGYQQKMSVEEDLWAEVDSHPADSQLLANKMDTVNTNSLIMKLNLDTLDDEDVLVQALPKKKVSELPKHKQVSRPILSKEESNQAVSEALMMVAETLNASFNQLENASEVMGSTTENITQKTIE